MMREIAPSHPCDRCGHESRWHGVGIGGSDCRIVRKTPTSGPRAVKCFCDTYVPKP